MGEDVQLVVGEFGQSIEVKEMKFILVDKILSTEKYSVNQIFEMKGKVYTYLNPVSYLTALDRKSVV